MLIVLYDGNSLFFEGIVLKNHWVVWRVAARRGMQCKMYANFLIVC